MADSALAFEVDEFLDIKVGRPIKKKGKEGPIWIDRIILGVSEGWHIRYILNDMKDEVIIRKLEALHKFLEENELRAPVQDDLVDFEDLGGEE
ncbi:hypothetical protein J2Z48_002971 [Croceifilum oryzae]|uniref:Uncharacterized protein n=1 Tax=Croceifilum oryzae TaxID=1553429 RepID=A0AAJ1WRQ4_9BACL|nr:hypothetical protein [Croceifilum oryzae]MDQ0418767.1 hypothetical protein [Croceifilum oryzae]